MIPQKKITNSNEIAMRIMNHIFLEWDVNSPAHLFWKRYAKRYFNELRKLQWREIYKIAKTTMNGL